LLLVIAIWLFIRQVTDRWWLGTLLAIMPRWPFLVPLFALAPLVVWKKSWRLCAVVVTTAIMALNLLMGFRIATPMSAHERGDLRILSFNVHRQQVDANQLADYIATVQPDVIALQDWSSANQGSLFASGTWNVHREGELLVASRYPIGKVTPLDFSDNLDRSLGERGAAACFELLTPSGPVNLINVHFSSPHNGLNSVLEDQGNLLARNVERRWEQSEIVRGLVEGLSDPVILAGDFNTTLESPIFREHWSDFTDAFDDRGLGFGYTYLNTHTQMCIDHVLVGPTWQTSRCWIGPEVGSPHRPLVADLVVR